MFYKHNKVPLFFTWVDGLNCQFVDLTSTGCDFSLFVWGCGSRQRRYLKIGEAVVEEDVPSAEEELLLADAQQTGHQRVQGLEGSEGQK